MDESAETMHPGYFETHFRMVPPLPRWPHEFVIISGFATTGETWTETENRLAHRGLERWLLARGTWIREMTGYSPETGHAEASWAVELPLEEACALGERFIQDAIFHVRGDQLSVTHCDHRRRLVPVGEFRERVDIDPNPTRWVRDGRRDPRRLVLQWWSEDEGVFYLEYEWAYLRTIDAAIAAASTWAEFSHALPPGEFESLSQWRCNDGAQVYRIGGRILFSHPDDTDEAIADDDPSVIDAADPFRPESLSGFGDGDYPPWRYEMFEQLPAGFVKSFGQRAHSFISGIWTEYPLERTDEMIAVLKAHGFEVRVVRERNGW